MKDLGASIFKGPLKYGSLFCKGINPVSIVFGLLFGASKESFD
jgi:hypothetical protein